MKFKGIELNENTEAELLVSMEIVGIDDEDELDEYGGELEVILYDNIYDCVDYDDYEIYIEFVDDSLLNVRCDNITFDEKGVEIIARIYQKIITMDLKNVKVMIGVHVDENEWFKSEDGSEYNEDIVTLDEFLENIEY